MYIIKILHGNFFKYNKLLWKPFKRREPKVSPNLYIFIRIWIIYPHSSDAYPFLRDCLIKLFWWTLLITYHAMASRFVVVLLIFSVYCWKYRATFRVVQKMCCVMRSIILVSLEETRAPKIYLCDIIYAGYYLDIFFGKHSLVQYMKIVTSTIAELYSRGYIRFEIIPAVVSW